RVGQRLFVAVLPAVLGVLAMAGLAYWGQRGREIPEWLLVAGILAAVASLVMAWRSTRYVARRIEALSRRRSGPAATDDPLDELDTLELRIAESERRGDTREQAAEALVREYAGLLADASATVGRKLEEVRMPLHILLADSFGALNENQEEMIAAARQAADHADEALRFIGRIVDLDAGRVEPHPAPIRPAGLVAPLCPAVHARAGRAAAVFTADVSPALPHVLADAAQAREALGRLLDGYLARAEAGGELRLDGERVAEGVRIRIRDGAPPPMDLALVRRLLRLQGAELRVSGDGTDVVFPVAPPA
ncbi:MAG TPA: hypothetical protein VE871_13715, partial [Longimicrobium sp.]|nr:hypothetical protein [Longimicrobium sp.]